MANTVYIGPSNDEINDGVATLLEIIREQGGDAFILTADDTGDEKDVIFVTNNEKMTNSQIVVEIANEASENEKIFGPDPDIVDYKDRLDTYFSTNNREIVNADLDEEAAWCAKELGTSSNGPDDDEDSYDKKDDYNPRRPAIDDSDVGDRIVRNEHND
jgi:hypothetical protein